jgi:hypothetical protein
MSRGKRLPLLVLAFALLVLCARSAHGCSCGKKQTVLDSYEWADVVVVARAVALETAPKKGEGRAPDEESEEDEEDESAESKGAGEEEDAAERKSGEAKEEAKPGEVKVEEGGEEEDWRRVVSTKMLVERVYKGGLKVGEEMVLAQGGGADCIYTFDKNDIGRAYLFYLKRLKGADFWIAGTCGRSRPVEGAHDDLLYLNNLDKARGRTRVSGTLNCFVAEGPDLAGLKIRVNGGGKTFEAKTDEHGVYELYDLPAGKYTLEPEIPHGWKVGNFWLGYSASFAGDEEEESPTKIPFVLEAKRHAALDVVFEIANVVGGKVFDTLGKPLNGVCLQLLPARGEIPKHYYKGDCTEKGGQFRIDELTPGDYVLAVNHEGKITSSEPFGTIYYPNAKTREEATVFHIGLGDRVENLEFHITKMEETVTAEGLFLYSDGRPVVDAFVEFRTEQNKDADDYADSQAKTDAKGRFSLKILKGQKGNIYGSMYAYVGQFENCPRLDSAIKKTGRDNAELTTPSVEIQADNNLYGVELRFPFPGCKKAKTE